MDQTIATGGAKRPSSFRLLSDIALVGLIAPPFVELIYARYLLSASPCRLARGDIYAGLLLVPILVLWTYTAARVWLRLRKENSVHWPALLGCALGSVMLAWGAFAIKELGVLKNPTGPADFRAAASMGMIVDAEREYAEKSRKGFSEDLAALKPYFPPDSMVAGTVPAYTFKYVPAGADAQGRIARYKVTASPLVPGKTGCREFTIDESGVLQESPFRVQTETEGH